MARILVLAALVLILTVPAASAAETTPLRLGCVAFAKEATATAYRQLQAYLTTALGRDVALTLYPSYHEVVHDVVNGRVDLAVLSPLVYLNARRAQTLYTLGYGVYGASGHFTYRSVVVVPRASKLRRLEDLGNARMAFVDRISASGYVLPQEALVRAGVTGPRAVRPSFLGNHVDAVRAVLEGRADAAATYDVVFADAPELAGDRTKLRVIWRSDFVIPSDAVVATGAVDAPTRTAVRAALLSYFAAQHTGEAERNVLYEGFVPGDPNLYTDLERLVATLTAP